MTTTALPQIPASERLLLVVGASGVGKDSVLRAWRARLAAEPTAPRVHFARRTITRPPDPHESHDAIVPQEFAALRDRGLLATWWHAHGLDYGIPHAELAPLAHGHWVVVNGSRAHLPALRAQAPGLRVVEITASPQLLAHRLANRGREDAEARTHRLHRHVPTPTTPDLVLVNDTDVGHAGESLHAWWMAQVRGPQVRGQVLHRCKT